MQDKPIDKRTVRENLATMNTRQKISYIWEYYKLHFIAALVIILTASYFVSIKLSEKTPVLSVTIVSQSINGDKFKNVVKDAQKKFVKKPNKERIILDYIQMGKVADASGVMTLGKIQGQLMAGNLDILVVSKDRFDVFAQQNAFINLNSIKELSQDNNKNFNYLKVKSENDKEAVPYGIDVNSFPVLKTIGLDNQDEVLCISAKAKNTDTAKKFIEWLKSYNN